MRMHTLKVWCLPEHLSETDLKRIWEDLYAVLRADTRLAVYSEHDVCILFPSDRMKMGLGSAIVIELEIDPQVHGLRKIEPSLGVKLRDALVANPKLSGARRIQSKVCRFNGITGIHERTPQGEIISAEPDPLGR